MCRHCGAIVGAGESSCAVCGAHVAGDPAVAKTVPHVDRETLRFARAILERPYKFTILFLIANLFIFFLMWQSSGMTAPSLWAFHPEVLIAYGAKVNYLIREKNEWWRIVAPMFVHGNLIHLLVNMYGLWIVGPYVEKLYGSAKFVFFWVATGVLSMFASYLAVVDGAIPGGMLGRFLLRNRDVPSIGASGALFGLVGVLFVFGIKFRHELPEGFKRAFGTGLLPMIALNLFIGYLGRGLFDNAAHLGGLLSGAALALVVNYKRPGERSGVAIAWRVVQFAALLLVAVSFVKVAQHFRNPLPEPVRAEIVDATQSKQAIFVSYARAFNVTQEALLMIIHENDPGRIDEASRLLEELPPLDDRVNSLREQLKVLLVRAKEFSARMASAPQPLPSELQKEQNALVTDFATWTANYNYWLKTDAQNYGFKLTAETPEASPQ
jgi:membrane associated rhomboid family serine protease